MTRLKYILCMALLASAPLLKAQNGIEIKTPERIVRMLDQMPVKEIPLSGQFQCTDLSSTLLFYTEAQDGVTVQLGARLFSDNVRKAYDPVIISFVERLWVELLLRKTTASQSSLLKEYGVRIVLGGYPLGSGSFTNLSQALDVINSINSLTLTTGGAEIDMLMRSQAGTTLHIYIPSSRDLLFPFDKKEHEERFITDLTGTELKYQQTEPEESAFTTNAKGLKVKGGDCYMIDSLRNDVFYTSAGTILLDPEKFPEETMRNILIGAVPSRQVQNIMLDITPHAYNRDIRKFTISLDHFIGYVQQQGFRFYTGDLGRDGERSQCLLAMFHPVYNYLHILSVSFTPGQLKQDGQVTLRADLSTFIPQHNIKNLFQEK